MIFITATIALVSGYVVGTGVTLAWEWGKLRKVHRRYRSQKWIPVSERLPEDCDPVLVTYKWSKTDREVAIGEYWGKPSEICPEEEKGWGKDGDHVTAWMPLPEPYREDGEEE